jgi:integrase
MFEAGIDALTAKEQLGHSDIKTTLSIYTHLSAQHKEKQVNKLDVFLQKGSQGVVSNIL